jgi:hypothetical protein
MEPTDITIEILKDIRTEIRANGARIDQTNERLDQTIDRLDQTNDRLDALHQRVVESEIRMVTALTDVAGTVNAVADMFRGSHDLRPRVENCEREILDLKRRLP